MKIEETRWDESSDFIRPFRKRVYYDDSVDSSIIIADEQVYSERDPDRVLTATTMELTWAEVEWLWGVLGTLLDKTATPMHDKDGAQEPRSRREPQPVLSAYDQERQLSLFEDK